MPEIQCGCCGGSHGSVSEVRACCAGGATATATPAPARSSPAPAPAPIREPVGPTGGGAANRDELGAPPPGRSVIVDADQGPPEHWDGPADAPRIVIDDDTVADPRAVIDVLGHRWARREPSIIELRVDLDEPPAEVVDDPVWSCTPDLELRRERLHHLVWSHALDARADGTDCDTWTLDDGTVVWIDGGPLGPPEPGGAHPPVPTIAAERGLARPLRAVASGAELAPDQVAAVEHTGGAARIIAPAGSGKTRVLTERARLLVAGWGVPASALCLVAFNTRAAAEMRERLADLPQLEIRTLNSLGLAIVAGTGPFATPGSSQRRVDVLDEPAVRDLLGTLVEFPRRTNTDPAAAWIEALTQVRLGLRPPGEVEAEYHGDVDGFTEVFDRYREALARRNAVDFDEQIYAAIELLLREPAVRHVARRACRVLLVDEFQDLTPAHLLLIRLLSAPRYDVFGVGDDDQTIYGYTGADPGWLIDYERYFPGAGPHALEVNYRCPPAVVDAAACLLTHNRRRVAKDIHPAPGRARDDAALTIERVDEPDARAVDRVRALLADGVAPGDIAVLTRVNALLAPAQVGLAEAGIPTTRPLGPNFLDRTGVRSTLAWLRVALSPKKLSARDVRETARRPSRGLSPKVIDWMCEQSTLDGVERLAGRVKDERTATRIADWAVEVRRLTDRARRASTVELIEGIRTETGLGRAVDTLDQARRTVDRSSHHDDLDALLALGRLHPDAKTFGAWLREHLTPAGPPPTDAVQLSTIHRVKGREWPHVVVLHASDGVLPHRLALDREEERRIFHVGVTRGASTVTVLGDASRPSPFLAELTSAWVPGTAPPPPAPARPAPTTRGSARTAAAGTDRAPIEWDDEQAALRERLREYRRVTAAAEDIPAYRVFPDASLDDIVLRRPSSYEELLACQGIGPTKLERYGDDILGVIGS